MVLFQEIDVLDFYKETRRLSALEFRQEVILLDWLEETRKQEKIYWRQRSRLQWLREGNENTKFFHAVANGRKNRNFIPCLQHEWVVLSSTKDIGRIFTDRFLQQFGMKRTSILRVDLLKLLDHKSHVNL